MFRWLTGEKEEKGHEEGEGKIVIRVEFGGKTYTYRYADLDMAQLRFPAALADLAALHGTETREER